MAPIAFATALLELFGKMIDGQTPEQRAKIWDQWIQFWEPLVNLVNPRQSK